MARDTALSFAARRHAAREAARQRIAARIVVPLPPVPHTVDLTSPLPVARLLRAGTSLLASALFHGALVGVAFAAGTGAARDPDPPPLIVEMRERPIPPPPPPEPEPPKAEVARPTPPPPRELPRRRVPPPPKAPVDTPPPPAAAPPPLVVGLSLDSTTASGDGPAFAVGNTRAGETETRARDPRRVPAVGVAPAPPTRNRVAENVPTAGVAFDMPERRRPSTPPYPETLKSQGIEADVTVLVRLDATGAVTAVEIVRSSGHAEFDRAARTAARAESFAPARRAGVAIPYSLSFTYRFRLETP